MGKAREQEIRVAGFGMIALVLLAALLMVSAGVALGGRLHVSLPSTSPTQDVGGASATYVQR
jgi:biopolymer transport protein ExbD